MSPTRRNRAADAESVPQLPQSTPAMLGQNLHGHDFTLQAVMEMQKSVGQMQASVDSLRNSVDGLKGKVDDLVGWKHKIVGGVAVIGVMGAVIGWALAKASDYVTIKVPAGAPLVVAPAAAPPAAAVPAPTPPVPRAP